MYLIFKYITFVLTLLFSIYVFVCKLNKKKVSVAGEKNNSIDRIYIAALEITDRYWPVILMFIFAVFCFTRFYALDNVPAGIHLDEIGYWYDAHNLAEYGRDRMGSRYPVLPASYGDGHNPCYCYMCMVMLKFFPFSIKLMRAVMGISAIPCFFASFGIIYQLYESRRWALLGPIFVTVMPYIFAANRWGLNANQMLYVCTVLLYFLIRALKYGKIRDYILAGVFFGISLLTYHLSYIMMPLFFVCTFVYLMIVREFKWKNALAAFIPFAVIGMPTFIEQLVNLGLIKPFYFLGSDYPRLRSYRVGEIAAVNLVKNIGNITALVFGDNNYTYNSVREFGTVYWAMIPLMIVGLIIAVFLTAGSFKERRLNLITPIILYGLCVYLGFIIVIGCNVYKGNAIFINFLILTVIGLRFLAGYKYDECASVPQHVSSDNGNEPVPGISANAVIVIFTLAIIALSFLLYTEFYFRRLNNTYGFQSLFKSSEPGDMIKYEEEVYNPNADKKVYMELNYEDRDYCEWLLALYLEMPYEEFDAYDFKKEELSLAGMSYEEIYKTVPFGHMMLAFPEDFDESEDAVYILGNSWDHISNYLTSVGFECDTSFPGYKILHR